MKAPKRDTQPKAAQAARRSAEGPKPSKTPRGGAAAARRAHNPKVAGSIPAPATKPARPRKLKPAPPITDCLKCQKLREAKADATHWRNQAKKYLGELEARTKAALAGVAVVLDKGAVERILEEELHPTFRQVVGVFRDIALNAAAEDKDRISAAKVVKDQVAGPIKQKMQLDPGEGGAIMFVSGLPVRDPVPANPEQSEGSGA